MNSIKVKEPESEIMMRRAFLDPKGLKLLICLI